MFHLWVPFLTIEHNKHLTLSSCAQQKYFSPHDSWKQISWQRQRRTCYRVQCHNVAWCYIYECLFQLSSTTNILHCHLVHNKNSSPPTILEMYVSLACFDRDMFRSKYAMRVRPWTFSMLCRWRPWGRGMYVLPLQRHTRETSLCTWLPMPGLSQ